ncbi:MAG: LPS-assembly protein LptD [Hyphomicrobiales bacterium]
MAKILAVATVWTLCLAMQLAGGFVVSKAQAQTSPAATSSDADKLTVDADEIVYDTDKKTIAARGNAKLYYKGKILEADQVIYRSDSERVFAEGHVVLTEPDGQVVRANSLELTDQFHDGFIKSMRVDTVDNTHFVAPRAERISGRQTIFERGTYTACDACKEDPTKPPLWQVKARRIIHNQVEKVIYYEDATLDLAGVPVTYFPYFSAPDNTITKKSGFLNPIYSARSTLGQGLTLPYYYVVSPDKDFTISPTYYSRQGLMLAGEWRQRLETGTYTINGAIISQNDQGAFLSSPNGAGDQRVRGYIETIGAFPINSRWRWGWDLAYVSDKWFYQNYKIDSPSVTRLGTIKRESTSTAFLHGEDKNSLFDARTYYFQTLLPKDNQNIQPLILPVVDYDRRYHLGGAIGGEVALNANFTNLSRLEADFGTLSGSCPSPTTTNCFMRGIGGDYSRYTTEIGWRRSFVDPLGQSWTPFASMRGDAAYATLFRNGTANAVQDNFLSTGNQGLTRAMGTIGMTYRFPFVAASSFGSHIFEPIVQVISRPNESNIGNLPNEDSQSLVFDDTNLFSVDKYTGYDRVEGGTRANYGAQYSLGMINGAHANMLIGQSVQMAGLNSFAQRGLALEGTDSGLDKTTSDYVSRLQFVPNANYSFTARGRFDPDGLNSKRFELENRASIGDLSTNLIYANYAAQPNVGITNRREGLGVGAGYRLTPKWSVAGNTLFALTRYLSDPDLPRAYIAAYSASATYHDECTDLSIAYIGREPYATGTTTQDQTIFVRLTLRSLGTIETKREVGSLAGQQ